VIRRRQIESVGRYPVA